jgi:MFS family permease
MNNEDSAVAAPAGTWRALWSSHMLGRFLLLCLGVWLHAADTLVTATITPSIVDEIGGVAYVSWMISLYQVGAIIAGAASAVLCQRLTLKRVLLAAALMYGIGCIIAAIAGQMAMLLAGRFIQGIGGGLLLSLCYLAIQQWFAPALWGRLYGINAFIWGAGSLLGPLIGGVFASLHAWRMAFWIFALQAAILWLLAARYLPAERPTEQRVPSIDWPLRPLLILLLATLIIAQSGVTGSSMLALFGCVSGALLLYLAARLDRRANARLLPGQLLDVRAPIGAGLLMVFALSVATTGFWAYGPLILKVLFATNPLFSGYALAAEALAWSLATMAVSAAPISADKLLIRAGAVAVSIGAAGFAWVVPAGSLAGIVVCSLLQGVGFGLFWPAVVHRLVRHAGPDEKDLAAASPSTIQRIGYALGTAMAGIAANLCGLAEGVSAAAARSAAFWVFAAFIPVLAAALFGAWRFTAQPMAASEPLHRK